MEGSEPISEVLGVIRIKDSIAAMDDRPRFRRIYGTDIDPENTRDNEWQELMARHRIKQRLQLARTRRMSKIKEMEKTIASSLKNSVEIPSSPEPSKRKPSKTELLEEYRAMKGKSVNMKPTPDISEGEREESEMVYENLISESGGNIKTDTTEKHTEEIPYTNNTGSRTTFISAVIETPFTKVDDRESYQGRTKKVRAEGEGKSAHEDNSSDIPDSVDRDEKNSNKKIENDGGDMEKSETGRKQEFKEEIIREDKGEINDMKKPKEDRHVENNEADDDEKTFFEEETEARMGEIEKADSGVNLNEHSQAEEMLSSEIPKRRVKQKKKIKIKSKTKGNSKTKENRQENLETKEDVVEGETKEHSENSNKVQTRWKKTAMKALPLSVMCSKLRERIYEENEKQMDLLETIRILRGISKHEFYKDISMEGSDESDTDDTTKKVESSQSPQAESQLTIEQYDNEALPEEEEEEKGIEEEEASPPVVVVEKREGVREQSPKKKMISRVDSRWPAGHKYHTKPAEQKYLSIYLKPIHKKLQQSKINIHSLPRTAKEITEYLQWREKLLEIAYLNEFSHLRKMSLMSFTMPLPGIEPRTSPPFSVSSTNRNSSRSTSSASKHNRHEITFQHHSMLTIRGTKEAKRMGNGTKLIQDQRQIKRKITIEKNIKPDNPYLVMSKTRHKKRNKQKHVMQVHENEKQQQLGFGFTGENDLETLISKITEGSKQEEEARLKSQSTDSAINEPSFNSDEDDCDVTKSSIKVTVREMDRCQENGHVLLRQESKAENKYQDKKNDADFMQTIRLLRTGRYRYLQHIDPVKKTNRTPFTLTRGADKQTS